MGSLSIWHWLIILVVVVVLFGTARFRNAGSDIAAAIKGFKKGMDTDPKKEPLDRPNNSISGNAPSQDETFAQKDKTDPR